MGLLQRLLGDANGTIEGEIRELTHQFHVTLRASFARACMVDAKPSAETLERLKRLLDEAATSLRWSNAYEVEQLLVDVYDEQAVQAEVQIRTLEAARTLHPQLAAFYRKELDAADSPERRRRLLARLVNDLQWRYTVNEVKRRYSKDITRRTGWVFGISLLAFGVGAASTVLGGNGASGATELELLIVAALAGTWGAAFSMLAGLKGRLEASELDDLKLVRPVVMTVSRALIGTGAGAVLYFLIRSGLLGGSAFPTLDNLIAVTETAPPQDAGQPGLKSFALLIVWCFIAGFSERLVPGILEKNAARAGATQAGDPGRYRPERSDAPPEPALRPAGPRSVDSAQPSVPLRRRTTG